MSVPKRRKTSSRVRQRRSHIHANTIHAGACAQCSAPIRPHHACEKCGSYNGRTVVDTSREVEKEVKKAAKAAEVAAPAEETSTEEAEASKA